MITIAQAAGVLSTESVVTETIEVFREGRPEFSHAIIAIIGFFGFLILTVLAILVFRYLRAKRQERLIELALHTNHPEIARELIGKRSSGWSWGWLTLLVVLVLVLGGGPLGLLILAAFVIVLMLMKPQRRAEILRTVAGHAGKAEDYLSRKADENAKAPGTPPDEPFSPQ